MTYTGTSLKGYIDYLTEKGEGYGTVKGYTNPVTGQPCTLGEYTKACASAGITPTTPTTMPTGGEITPQYPAEQKVLAGEEIGIPPPEMKILAPTLPSTVHPSVTPTIPVFGEGAGAGVPTPTITPAPPYVKTEAQIEFEETLGTILTDWVQAKGYGLEPEVQAQMIQKQTDTLKAREQEAIRVMKINMERRGITNSGYVQANMNMITSGTSVAIAGAIADVQIKSALMKMASFEKAMGAAAQFLGYLSEQSQLAYAPEFATWQAEQLTKMQVWQGKLDVYKMELNQAYQKQNMTLQAQLTSQLNQEQHQFDLELAEMEIEANQEIAMAQGIGGIFGTILGFLFGK